MQAICFEAKVHPSLILKAGNFGESRTCDRKSINTAGIKQSWEQGPSYFLLHVCSCQHIKWLTYATLTWYIPTSLNPFWSAFRQGSNGVILLKTACSISSVKNVGSFPFWIMLRPKWRQVNKWLLSQRITLSAAFWITERLFSWRGNWIYSIHNKYM